MVYFLTDNKPVTKRWRDADSPRWPKVRSIFDGKDDENFVYRTKVMTSYTGVVGAAASAGDIALWPRPNPGLANALMRIKFWCVPIVGSGLAYTSVVQLSANVRGGKTDYWNHFYGGFASGVVIGKCAKCFVTGCVLGLFLGLTGLLLKDSAAHNNFPDVDLSRKRYGGAFSHKYDFTLFPERQGYWARTPEEIPKLMERGQV